MTGLTYFIHLFNSGGIVMYPLVLLSIITIAIATERFYYYKNNCRSMKGFCHGIYHAVKKHEWTVAKQLCKEYPTAISRIIGTGLDSDISENAMKNAFEEQMTIESASFRRYLDYLSAIVTIAPLLGLLGTVTGMINTFSILDGGAGANAISGGVGEALVATATGLCVAIISFSIYTYFNHQLDTIVNDTENLCIVLLNAKKGSWDQ